VRLLDVLNSYKEWLSPVLRDFSADNASPELLELQWQRMVRQMPILSLLNIIFTLSVISACAVGAMPTHYLILPGLGLVVLLYRVAKWYGFRQSTLDAAQVDVLIRRSSHWATALTVLASLWSVFAFFDVQVSGRTLIPVFIAVSALVAANCFASLPRTAAQVLAAGILPSSLAFIFSGEPIQITLAIGLILAGILQIQLVVENHRQWHETVQLGQQMRLLANTDALTGLCNRRSFSTQFEAACSAAGAKRSFGIAILDLDEFKPVNDRYGHIVGDQLLQAIAERMTAHSSKGDVICRLGGDEFAVLFTALKRKGDLQRRAAALIEALAEPALVEGHIIPIRASLGFALYPDDGETPDSLLRIADKALYKAKASSKHQAACRPSLARAA
jgi:diguanylate cyclase